ncbi:tRNA pseudouridine synthase Pus10 [Tribolium castaneum]|uniref:tRNA pseudouridine(55) synthase n=1 Tax=Tribolium castaneum TaxID=7070 RepID=D6W8D0_TRICA|nr:PREDICTED: putative tRNA pseudouridine synthase Pus10 [Tribolium castaneum]EFA10881.1 Putative tRNA pseudouridine synthase Pus10-like Protein [Tribolium castaneum]|eukprot:XP_970341.2 PREDICTED: putative tRNA pseudouridine synthase Pus10 [Tribolium castaneum]
MTESDKAEVFNFLLETGCCKRCALRYVGDNTADYDNPQQNGHDQLAKKTKLNSCIICLDLLQDVTLESMVQCEELEGVKEYDCKTFINFISFPVAVLIREHSMEIHMNEKFPKFFEDRNIVPINRAWSLSIQNKLGEKLGKKFNKDSLLQIQFNTTYEFEKEESSIMFLMESRLKKSNGQNEGLSRNVIGEFLKTINTELFKKHAAVPPEPPGKALSFDQVAYKHDYIFIAGRYCKYSRNLFQTPWANDEVQVINSSVQEILFKSLESVFKCSSLVFSSSGREDFDVRMLGRGRPFFVKICDPKVTTIPFEQFRLIEKQIEETNLIEVRDLQFISRKLLNNIKEGEQFKQKTYRALCVVDKPEKIGEYIEKINNMKRVKLLQKTPLRVYHRRSADVREKEIYNMEARPVTGASSLFELDVLTQAGTYVKEFVHGDLGRTRPSLREIMGGYVDIIALDVLDIHLDFPPRINKKQK